MAVVNGDEAGVPEGAQSRPISSIVIITAVQSQALPLAEKFQLVEDAALSAEGFPWVRYSGVYKNLCLNVIWLGKDLALGVDSVGTVSAALVAYASIQALKPDLIINAGTAGGLKVCDLYCIGTRQAFSTPDLLKELNLKAGKLSTGNSLDICPQDEKLITANDAAVKDMEGAAIAYVADLLKIPIIFIKAVSYIVHDEKPDSDNYLKNLMGGSVALDEAVVRAIEFTNGKRLSEL
ncbi:5'-methylthioadenosine/S-adenosylhomocysteine nucleosidase 1-like isoform X2 [Punica granatum]|uniref:5'-methylthioadenosine/S-adenosylhomocysteine nucleosidase 1-like isoform X2 n=1 Tax=Punica granatum TaxID=22663 RepID=A0A6P8D8S0_PUNGR|nr:5'-methylthioadenosine/S-adenosylhomocysteine nucleosidase 1-like isoform X2 [Punica granatum]